MLGIRRTLVRRIPRGFTLVEIAIAIFIITILLGSILVPLTTQVEQRQVSETQKMLEDIKEALIGHAIAKGYLPCTDVTSGAGANDGVEDVAAGTCVSSTAGNVPWVTLGLGASDVWGNRFRYRVDANFTRRSPALPPPPTPFDLTSAAGLSVCTKAACPTATTRLTSSTAGEGAVAVILSHGRNGYGAIKADTGTANPAPTSADEVENLGGSGYASRAITPFGSTAGEFDDIVIWLGKYTLFQRMVAAGKLP